MKTFKKSIIPLIFLMVLFACHHTCNEESEIRKTVEDYYLQGLKERDFSKIEKICIEQAMLYGVRDNGTMGVTSLEKWKKRFDPENPPFKNWNAK